jgi:hypothetical protein
MNSTSVVARMMPSLAPVNGQPRGTVAGPSAGRILAGAYKAAQGDGRHPAMEPAPSLREREVRVLSQSEGVHSHRALSEAALAGITDPEERRFIQLQLSLYRPTGQSLEAVQAEVIAMAKSSRADELVVRHLGEGLKSRLGGSEAAPWKAFTASLASAPAQVPQAQRAWLTDGANQAFVDSKRAASPKARLEEAIARGWMLEGDLNVQTATGSGGKSGSKQVHTASGTFQLKSPVGWFSRFVKRKTAGPHTDNFAELIGSRLARSLAADGRGTLIPQVSLVHDPKRQQLKVASRYLAEPEHCQTLDGVHLAAGGTKDKKTHHARVDLRPETPDAQGSSVLVLRDPQQVKDLCENIALSGWVDDADVNPGNMIEVTAQGQRRLGRIDFGHAFADLVFAPKLYGGGRDPQANAILDFFNREKVGGSKWGGSPNKIWRNYIGAVPSQAMTDALRGLSERAAGDQLAAAVAQARAPFDELVRALKDQPSKAASKLSDDARMSLAAISQRLGVRAHSGDLVGMVNEVFATLANVMSQRAQQMADVAALSQLQVDIDQYIAGSRLDGEAGVPDIPEAIQTAYDALAKGAGTIPWLKCFREERAPQANLTDYIARRSLQVA